MARQKAARESIHAAVDMAGAGGTMARRARAMLRSGGGPAGTAGGSRIWRSALTLLESCRECGV
ncbi:MAG: hypothetical protein OXU86_07175, partial [Thaumarchaeota archaeon]|nr:hypothetical protein [Nitrososphaerota archaeon]